MAFFILSILTFIRTMITFANILILIQVDNYMIPVLVADTEVFKHYFLFVALKLPDEEFIIIDNYRDMRKFYELNKDAIWCFYNAKYDAAIIKAALFGLDVKAVNDWIIHQKQPAFKYSPEMASSNFPMNCFDVKTSVHGLKVIEAFMGEDIRETTVPFDLNRELTDKEKDEVIFYCKHDVAQTFKVLKLIKPTFVSHLNVCKMFNLPLTNMIKTPTQLSEVVLNVKRDNVFADEFNLTILPNVRLKKYAHVLKWFLDRANLYTHQNIPAEEIYKMPKLTVDICGIDVTFGWGGLHGAIPTYHQHGIIGCYDVTGLYSSMMVKYKFFSRNMRNSQRYIDMYDERNRLKAAGDPKNKDYKLILNSTYGALKSEYSPSYDPLMANNICVNGQLLLLTLLEMADDFLQMNLHKSVEVVNVNTDGVYLWFANEELRKQFDVYVNQWSNLTNLPMEYEEYACIHQRDVNNYIMYDADKHAKGKGILKLKSPLDNDLPILSEAIRNFFIHDIPIEHTVNSCDEMIKFQIVYKVSSAYKHAQLMGEDLKMNKVFRVFASIDYKDGPLKKVKEVIKDGKIIERVELFANTPPRCKIVNENIINESVPNWLDKEWYIKRINDELDKWYPKEVPSMIELYDALI